LVDLVEALAERGSVLLGLALLLLLPFASFDFGDLGFVSFNLGATRRADGRPTWGRRRIEPLLLLLCARRAWAILVCNLAIGARAAIHRLRDCLAQEEERNRPDK
jgi:hypothetical protein